MPLGSLDVNEANPAVRMTLNKQDLDPICVLLFCQIRNP